MNEKSRHLRVLLAEDNPVNRRIAQALLQQAGHGVHCVENGREALEAVNSESFDLVVMDIQMPELDGLSAARAIREAERGTGRHLPILALTAQALSGDRERCLEAGMDAYVSKPFQPATLFEAISAITEVAVPPEYRAVSNRTYNAAQLLEDMAGDEELMREVIGLYLDEGPRMFNGLKHAIERSDPLAVEREAHGLKGSLLAVAAGSASALARELEKMGRSKNLEGASEMLAQLSIEMKELQKAFSAFPAPRGRRSG